MDTLLPPLPATGARTEDEKQVTLVRAHENAAPPPSGHNLLTGEQRDLLRSGIARVRRLQAEIDRLNREKSAAYDALRKAEVDPALARKVVYRLTLSTADLEAMAERDAKLAAYWDAVSDLRVDEDAPDTDDTSDLTA